MSVQNNWRRVGRILSGKPIKSWYKKFVRRRNRRKARQNPVVRDKPLNPWDID